MLAAAARRLLCLSTLAFPAAAPGHGTRSSPGTEDLAAFRSDSVEVRPSIIPGAGLGAFARRDFLPGEVLGRYLCEVAPQMGGNHDYAAHLNRTHSCDAEYTKRGNPLR